MGNFGKYCCFLLVFGLLACRSQNSEYTTLDYAALDSLDISLPHIYSFGNDRQILVYGSYHTTDPEDIQIADIRKKLIDFEPSIVLYEGDGISVDSTAESTVSAYFEMGLAKYLADSLGISTLNIEPLPIEKYRHLLIQYPKHEVLLATLGLQITMMQFHNEDFDNMYPVMIKSLVEEEFPLTEKERTRDYFDSIYFTYFNHHFSYDHFDSRTIQAKYNNTSLNRINQEANKFRDQHIIALVESILNDHNRIYLQIGGWHAIVCEPAFREIYEE